MATAAARREPAGRKPTYRETMGVAIGVRLNEEQATAIARACARMGTNPSALVREAALERVDKRLGVGFDKIVGLTSSPGFDGPVSLPVRFTVAQARAVRAYCAQRKIPVATFLREVALARVGASDLGVSRVLE